VNGETTAEQTYLDIAGVGPQQLPDQQQAEVSVNVSLMHLTHQRHSTLSKTECHMAMGNITTRLALAARTRDHVKKYWDINNENKN